ncbi:hypothetical protein ABBQ38_014813 [Trebouxia sp. C0009 RCD-2024]
MLASKRLRSLLRGVASVRLSAGAHAALSTSCKACRAVDQTSWQQEAPMQHFGVMEFVEPHTPKSVRRTPWVQKPSEVDILSWPIHEPKHLSRRIMIARTNAMAAMLDPAAAPAAMDTFLRYLGYWSEKHQDKFNPIASSLALLSLARLATRPEVPASHQKKVLSAAAVMLKHFMSRATRADQHSTANVFWACARLRLRPDDLQPGFEDKLAQCFIATAHDATPQGISNVLWSCSTLRINPLNGGLLATIVALLKTWQSDSFNGASNMQSLAVVMTAFATMRLHIDASVAELLLKRFYEGTLQGADEPQGLSNLLWACASLGFCPPPHMTRQFMHSYRTSRQPYMVQHETIILYSLAVFGALTTEYFKVTLQKLHGQQLDPPSLSQLYIALQALRPLDSESPAHKDWLQTAHSVQQQWPLATDPAGKQSPFELKIYFTLLNMGYEAITTYDSDDGLHFIDIALLPQKKLPCKIAIEADGISHFLYEDYRLQNAPHPATRQDGRTLFRNSVLRKQGWVVVTVPWYDWHGLMTQVEKVQYLKRMLKQVVKEYWQASKSAV